METGTAVHCAVLEPEKFELEYTEGLSVGRRSKVDKEAWLEFEEDHAGQTCLTPKDWDQVWSMRESVMAHPTALELLSGEGLNEVTLIWNDEETEARCKGRLDRLTEIMQKHEEILEVQPRN